MNFLKVVAGIGAAATGAAILYLCSRDDTITNDTEQEPIQTKRRDGTDIDYTKKDITPESSESEQHQKISEAKTLHTVFHPQIKTRPRTKVASTIIYDDNGYDEDGFDRRGKDRDGYDRKGYNADGFNRQGYNRDGYKTDGYNDKGIDRDRKNKDYYRKRLKKLRLRLRDAKDRMDENNYVYALDDTRVVLDETSKMLIRHFWGQEAVRDGEIKENVTICRNKGIFRQEFARDLYRALYYCNIASHELDADIKLKHSHVWFAICQMEELLDITAPLLSVYFRRLR